MASGMSTLPRPCKRAGTELSCYLYLLHDKLEQQAAREHHSLADLKFLSSPSHHGSDCKTLIWRCLTAISSRTVRLTHQPWQGKERPTHQIFNKKDTEI